MDDTDARLERWRTKAYGNVTSWGVQETDTLLLAAMEELGELTQAYLEHRAENGSRRRITDELDDLGALLIQICWSLDGLPGRSSPGGGRWMIRLSAGSTSTPSGRRSARWTITGSTSKWSNGSTGAATTDASAGR